MTAKLGDICAAIIDCEHKTAPAGDGYALSVGTKAMKNGRLVLASCKPVSRETYELWTRRLRPLEGDLILAREAPVGDVVRVPESSRICLGQRTVLIRPDTDLVDPRFLHYWLLGPIAQTDMHAQASGATVPHLNVEDIRELDVSAVPNDLQLQSHVGATLGAIDDLIENNRRRIALLEQIAQGIHREWFVRFRYPGHEDAELVDSPLGGIPADWSLEPLGALGEVVSDSVDPSTLDSATPSVGLEHIPRRSFTLTEWGRACDLSSRKTRFSAGDVLFGKIRPYFHKVCVAPIDGIASTDAIVARPRQDVRGLVTMTMFSDNFVAHAVTTSNGTKMPRADWKVLREWLVPIPPDATLSVFEQTVASAMGSCAALASQSRTLAELRDLLLPKLVTGEVDVSQLDLDALLEESAA